MKTCGIATLIALSLTSTTLFAAEKYKSIVNDGTPTNIQSNTRVNDDGNEPDDALAQQDTGEIPEPSAPGTSETQEITQKPVSTKEPKKNVTEVIPVEAPAPKAATACTTVQPAVAIAPKPAKKYDRVPDTRISELAERLKYTNDILKRFGFAFDYRATTLAELKSAIVQLEASESKKKSIN